MKSICAWCGRHVDGLVTHKDIVYVACKECILLHIGNSSPAKYRIAAGLEEQTADNLLCEARGKRALAGQARNRAEALRRLAKERETT